MYYIATEDNLGLSRKCKTLADFMRGNLGAIEGSRWAVRKQADVAPFEFMPVYVIQNGKLKKTKQFVGGF
jgi:hypothetical protein